MDKFQLNNSNDPPTSKFEGMVLNILEHGEFEDIQHVLEHFADYLKDIGDVRELSDVLTCFPYLQAKILHEDYDSLMEAFSIDSDKNLSKSVQDIQKALTQASYVLRDKPQQLATQLHARLLTSQNNKVKDMVDRISSFNAATWLKPKESFKHDINSALVRVQKCSPNEFLGFGEDETLSQKQFHINRRFIKVVDSSNESVLLELNFEDDVQTSTLQSEDSRFLIINFETHADIYDFDLETIQPFTIDSTVTGILESPDKVYYLIVDDVLNNRSFFNLSTKKVEAKLVVRDDVPDKVPFLPTNKEILVNKTSDKDVVFQGRILLTRFARLSQFLYRLWDNIDSIFRTVRYEYREELYSELGENDKINRWQILGATITNLRKSEDFSLKAIFKTASYDTEAKDILDEFLNEDEINKNTVYNFFQTTNKKYLIGYGDRCIHVWNMLSSDQLKNQNAVVSSSFFAPPTDSQWHTDNTFESNNGNFLLLKSDDYAYVFSLETGLQITSIPFKNNEFTYDSKSDFIESNDKSRLFITSANKVYVIDVPNQKLLHTINNYSEVIQDDRDGEKTNKEDTSIIQKTFIGGDNKTVVTVDAYKISFWDISQSDKFPKQNVFLTDGVPLQVIQRSNTNQTIVRTYNHIYFLDSISGKLLTSTRAFMHKKPLHINLELSNDGKFVFETALSYEQFDYEIEDQLILPGLDKRSSKDREKYLHRVVVYSTDSGQQIHSFYVVNNQFIRAISESEANNHLVRKPNEIFSPDYVNSWNYETGRFVHVYGASAIYHYQASIDETWGINRIMERDYPQTNTYGSFLRTGSYYSEYDDYFIKWRDIAQNSETMMRMDGGRKKYSEISSYKSPHFQLIQTDIPNIVLITSVNCVNVFDIESGTIINSIQDNNTTLLSVFLTEDGDIATRFNTERKELSIWNIEKLAEARKFETKASNILTINGSKVALLLQKKIRIIDKPFYEQILSDKAIQTQINSSTRKVLQTRPGIKVINTSKKDLIALHQIKDTREFNLLIYDTKNGIVRFDFRKSMAKDKLGTLNEEQLEFIITLMKAENIDSILETDQSLFVVYKYEGITILADILHNNIISEFESEMIFFSSSLEYAISKTWFHEIEFRDKVSDEVEIHLIMPQNDIAYDINKQSEDEFNEEKGILITGSHIDRINRWYANFGNNRENDPVIIMSSGGKSVTIRVENPEGAYDFSYSADTLDIGESIYKDFLTGSFNGYLNFEDYFTEGGELVLSKKVRRTNLQFFDIKSQRFVKTVKAHDGDTSFIEETPDGKFLLTASNEDFNIHIWNPEKAEIIRTVKHQNLNQFRLSELGYFTISFSTDNVLKIFHIETGKEILSTVLDDYIRDLHFFEETGLVIGLLNGKILQFQVENFDTSLFNES